MPKRRKLGPGSALHHFVLQCARDKCAPRGARLIFVAVDIGGTFTDTVVADASGAVERYKAATTPDDLVLVVRCTESGAVLGPLGDLFESLIKRDAGAKDAGSLFGAHGGALDRLDGVMFTIVAGYYIWLAVLSH